MKRKIEKHLAEARTAIYRSDQAGGNTQELRELREALWALVHVFELEHPHS